MQKMSIPILYLFRLLSYDLLPFYKKTRKTGQFDLSETVEITVGVDRQDTAVHIHRRDALLVAGFHSAGHQLVHLLAAAGADIEFHVLSHSNPPFQEVLFFFMALLYRL